MRLSPNSTLGKAAQIAALSLVAACGGTQNTGLEGDTRALQGDTESLVGNTLSLDGSTEQLLGTPTKLEGEKSNSKSGGEGSGTSDATVLDQETPRLADRMNSQRVEPTQLVIPVSELPGNITSEISAINELFSQVNLGLARIRDLDNQIQRASQDALGNSNPSTEREIVEFSNSNARRNYATCETQSQLGLTLTALANARNNIATILNTTLPEYIDQTLGEELRTRVEEINTLVDELADQLREIETSINDADPSEIPTLANQAHDAEQELIVARRELAQTEAELVRVQQLPNCLGAFTAQIGEIEDIHSANIESIARIVHNGITICFGTYNLPDTANNPATATNEALPELTQMYVSMAEDSRPTALSTGLGQETVRQIEGTHAGDERNCNQSLFEVHRTDECLTQREYAPCRGDE